MNLFSDLINELPLLLLSLPIVLLAISVHEAAHGYTAYKLGDPTAYNMGRITLNPFKHIDPIGFICMLFFRIGWARPVPVAARNFKKPRRDMALVGLAGPVSNLILGFIGVVLFEIAYLILSGLTFPNEQALLIAQLSLDFLKLFGYLNISFAVFNLIPIPPFDGSRFLYAVLPIKLYFNLMKYERYFVIVLLLLLAFGPLRTVIQIVTNAIFGGMVWLVELIPLFK